ncbi:hypothetical protein MKZ38_007589 [Zalerion maritima]|uniref:DUF3074 domain-containing protein n=1 Tax=Zalerion maritima TaxID=339359 RepID=A0AAD5RUP5_9PEZI|nr:hypothetical protein MKZ38_007589 [Zalerion maritima]
MAKHHEPFNALGPIEWAAVRLEQEDEEKGGLGSFLSKTFGDAQTIVDSIPAPPVVDRSPAIGRRSTTTTRLRSHTDSSVLHVAAAPPHFGGGEAQPTCAGISRDAKTAALADKIRGEWKEVKINPRDNPLDIKVYKLGAKDGKGGWFARRSVHDSSLPFERWRLALEREFAESLKCAGKPGGGNIRGIGAERRVEVDFCDGLGRLEVYRLSAQFPGPTTPRDFVTLLLTSDTQPTGADDEKPKMRQFMVVSKPCNHPECPPRPGFIRGQYESVELIREIPLNQPPAPARRRARSSTDLRADTGGQDAEEIGTAIEWLMATRSDPGGSVPRFMVEKGTPSGIVTDAIRFLKWATVKEPKSFAGTEGEGSQTKTAVIEADSNRQQGQMRSSSSATLARASAIISKSTSSYPQRTGSIPGQKSAVPHNTHDECCHGGDSDDDGVQNPGGFYSMMSSAIGAASVAVTSRLPSNPFPGTAHTIADENLGKRHGDSGREDGDEEKRLASDLSEDEADDVDDDDDDKSSVRTFASAIEPSSPVREEPTSKAKDTSSPPPASVLSKDSRASSSLSMSTTTQLAAGGSTTNKESHHKKEMRKLDARRRKLDDKLEHIQARSAERGAVAREKAEKDAARLEAKYQKEMQKLEQKRLAEEKKAHERVIKQQEREDKKKMRLEMDKTKTERDLAKREIEMLRAQVGELQAQNTRLVARLGRMGIDVNDET